MKVIKTNMAQIHGAIAGLEKWLAESPDFPFKVEKIGYAGEIERFGMHHYILKLHTKEGPCLIGVAGGYTNDTDIEPFRYVGLADVIFSEKTMYWDAERMLDNMHHFFETHSLEELDDSDGDQAEEGKVANIIFLPHENPVPVKEVIRTLQKRWHVENAAIQGSYAAAVNGWRFSIHQMPMLSSLKGLFGRFEAQEEQREIRRRIDSCKNVMVVLSREDMEKIEDWGASFAVLTDACMEAAGAIGVSSAEYWQSWDMYRKNLKKAIKEKCWPFSNFFGFGIEKDEHEPDTIRNVHLIGTATSPLPDLEIVGAFEKEEIPVLKKDLQEIAEQLLFCRSPGMNYIFDALNDENKSYPALSGRYYKCSCFKERYRVTFTFFVWGKVLDDVEKIMKEIARKGLAVKKIVEAGKRGSWFLRWAFEKGIMESEKRWDFEYYLGKNQIRGDWRYAFYYAAGGMAVSHYIVWKYRLFAEEYYSGRGNKGYKGQLKAYAMQRLKGTKFEERARLAGIHGFAYLPYDEETYENVAAMIDKAFEAWKTAHGEVLR